MPETSAAVKRRHALHTCRSPEEFLSALNSRLGANLSDYLRTLVPGLNGFSAWLVGSIPAGVATAASDIDILVCVPSSTTLQLPGSRDGAGVIFSGSQQARRDALQLADLVLLADGMEIDVSFIASEGLDDLCRQVGRGGSGLTSQQILIIGRVLRGWLLVGSPSSEGAIAMLRESRALDTHCTVRYLVGAFKHIEDAVAALPDEPMLACHLARLAVEKCFEAALASHGELAVGMKWLRRVAAVSERQGAAGQALSELRRHGEWLLFPSDVHSRSAASDHVHTVERFFRHVVNVIGRDLAMRIAIRSSPQLHITTIENA